MDGEEKFVNCAKCPMTAFCTLAEVLCSLKMEGYARGMSIQIEEYKEIVENLKQVSEKCPLLSLLSNYAPISMGGKKVEVPG